jgi:hypothetical protein
MAAIAQTLALALVFVRLTISVADTITLDPTVAAVRSFFSYHPERSTAEQASEVTAKYAELTPLVQQRFAAAWRTSQALQARDFALIGSPSAR